MVDLLRDVETRDTARLISTNIFITQFFVKFDIRTVMLVSNILPLQISKTMDERRALLSVT
jgi:hypothetical protein